MPRHYRIEMNGDLAYIQRKTTKSEQERTGMEWLFLRDAGHGPFQGWNAAWNWLFENKMHRDYGLAEKHIAPQEGK